jgi:hypothetical protein
MMADLKEALVTVAGQRGSFDARELGKWLSRHKDRIAKGVRLEGRADGHGHPDLGNLLYWGEPLMDRIWGR